MAECARWLTAIEGLKKNTLTRQIVCEPITELIIIIIIKYLNELARAVLSRGLKCNAVAFSGATAELADITAGEWHEHGIQRQKENGSANSTWPTISGTVHRGYKPSRAQWSGLQATNI